MQFGQDECAQHFGISVDTQMAKIQDIHVFLKLNDLKMAVRYT
jgi:hypothetical protein